MTEQIAKQNNSNALDILPNNTLYVNNINEKIKADGNLYLINY
jgi:hypothetical protein